MNREQRQAEAVESMKLATQLCDRDLMADAQFWATIAVAHATLAAIPDPVEAGPRSFQLPDGWCACLRLAYQHRVTPLCDTTPMPPPAPRLPVPDEPMCVCGATGVRAHDRRTTKGCRLHPAPVAPECQETNPDEYGDCDGRVVEVEQVETRYGLVRGSRLFLCRSHRTQAIERGAIRAFHPSRISDGPGS